MFATGKSRVLATIAVVGQLGTLGALTATHTVVAQSVKLTQSTTVADPNILRIQEGLVWTGYYEGPVDGSAGAGTQSAIKRFQHDIGKPETGSLDDPQAAMLAQRAQVIIQQTGYRPVLDTRSGIRTGMPLGLTSQHKSVTGGSDYASADSQMQIGLRVFRTGKDAAALFNELKGRLEGSSATTYSAGRNTWFVLAGESDSRKYYLRYTTGPDLIAGFFSVHDKSLPRETTGPYVAAVTLMSLTMQTFAADLGKEQISALTDIGQLEPVALSSAGPSPQQAQPSAAAPLQPQPAPSANDATVQALQKKIIALEAKQRQLEQQLAAKTADAPAKPATIPIADTPPRPTPQTKPETTAKDTTKPDTPAKPKSSGQNVGYGTIAALVLACVLLVLFWRRRSSLGPSTAGATASTASPAATVVPDAGFAAQDVPPLLQHPDKPAAAATPAAAMAAAGTPALTAASANGGGLDIILVSGGMVLLVFLLAFAVSKIATLAGFS